MTAFDGRFPPEADMEQSYQAFLAACPEYEATLSLDELRSRDFSRLDAEGHVYLDYTGGGLYAESQVRRHTELLLGTVFGNPHSSNPTSLATTERIERCRGRVLEFFNASPDEYAVIFTANASQALKLVGESYPFGKDDRFLLTFDNHNSVNGIREFDRVRGAETMYVPLEPPLLRVPWATIKCYLSRPCSGENKLFAYPAQSNFSGVQHPLEWIELAHSMGWDVLLDAAAFVPTNRLDLGQVHPDYVALSFYKMFGYPTGVGALIGRREALDKLHRPWFAGGTIAVASVQADLYSLVSGPPAFEDGTLDYTNIPAVEFGLDFVDAVGLDMIHDRVLCLAHWLIEGLLSLRHKNGRPLILLYGPRDRHGRGGTITVNFLTAEGGIIDHEVIEGGANKQMISLRTGCFCNPGAGELALGLSRDEIVSCFRPLKQEEELTYENFRSCIDSKGTGAVRVSVGSVTNFADIFAFLSFANGFLS